MVLTFAGSAALAAPPAWVPPGVQADQTAAKEGFLLSMDLRQAGSSLPLPGARPIAFPGEDDVPALVPLAPPAWAGLGLLAALAWARHKNRRQGRRA